MSIQKMMEQMSTWVCLACRPDVASVQEWLHAIESAMKNPVAVAEEHGLIQDLRDYPPGTRFYAFPPDAAAEIQRLRTFNAVEIERLRQGNERLREAVTRLLACPAIADEDFSGPEWGCAETREAEAFARSLLRQKEPKT